MAAAKHRVILDCDPGVDDAVALLLAYASPDIALEGVTTVVGNKELAVTAPNALRVAGLAGRRDVPVLAGCARPIMAPFVRSWPSVHGDDGLGGIGLPPPDFALTPGHAVDFIVDTVMAAPGEITLVPVGPMTNVALAMVKEPRVATSVKSIVFMGGAAFTPGNASPLAEFNFFVDPEAAEIVLSSGAPLTMFGLDVTRQAHVGSDWLDRIAGLGDVGAAVAAMVRSYGSADPCLHDPCAVAWLIAPELFSGIDAHVSVLCTPPAARGAVVAAVSERHRAGRAPNCRVVTGCDNAGLLDLLERRLATY